MTANDATLTFRSWDCERLQAPHPRVPGIGEDLLMLPRGQQTAVSKARPAPPQSRGQARPPRQPGLSGIVTHSGDPFGGRPFSRARIAHRV
jgi:hypothetical protein